MSTSSNTSPTAVSARLHRAGFTTVSTRNLEGIRVSRGVLGSVHVVVDHDTPGSAHRVADLLEAELQGWEGYDVRRNNDVHFYVTKSQPAEPAPAVVEAVPAPELLPGQPVTDGTGRIGIVTSVSSKRGTRAGQVGVMYVGAPYSVYEQTTALTVTGPLFALEPDAPATYREALAAEAAAAPAQHDMRAAWQFVVDSYDGQAHSPARRDWTNTAILEFVAEHHVDGADAYLLEQPTSEGNA